MRCRHCHSDLSLTFVDLGSAPPSNAYLSVQSLHSPEKWFPLRVMVCTDCWLVQTEDYSGADELFSKDYAYFSSFSTTWLQHAKDYARMAVERFKLGKGSKVVEVAANDGYLLQYFKAREIPCLGVEPTAGTAAAARIKGIEIIEDFFGVPLAQKMLADGLGADLMIANNVLAHVPDINDFVAGFATMLKPNGVATFEFPHLMRLVEGTHFDTIYHEHYSYLSLTVVKRIFEANGLVVFDAEELPTHGGSLRVFTTRQGGGTHPIEERVQFLLQREAEARLCTREYYADFQTKADRVKDNFLLFLLNAKRQKKKVAAYGAAAKGNTLLNYAGVRSDLIEFVVDRNPAKQGQCLPGSRIPIVDEGLIREHRPDFVLILPWNLRTEIMNQLSYIRDWKGQFFVAVPELDFYRYSINGWSNRCS